MIDREKLAAALRTVDAEEGSQLWGWEKYLERAERLPVRPEVLAAWREGGE